MMMKKSGLLVLSVLLSAVVGSTIFADLYHTPFNYIIQNFTYKYWRCGADFNIDRGTGQISKAWHSGFCNFPHPWYELRDAKFSGTELTPPSVTIEASLGCPLERLTVQSYPQGDITFDVMFPDSIYQQVGMIDGAGTIIGQQQQLIIKLYQKYDSRAVADMSNGWFKINEPIVAANGFVIVYKAV
jgi:hypothetical protein